MKYFIMIILLLTSNITIAKTLDAYTRNVIPINFKSVHQQVSYLIEPFNYTIVYDEFAPIEAKKIGSNYAKSTLVEFKAYPVTTLILSLLPNDVALVIDENNKLISFQYLNQ